MIHLPLLLLPDLDSNQDILNQNQLYYPYTIRQSRCSLSERAAKIGLHPNRSKFFKCEPVAFYANLVKNKQPLYVLALKNGRKAAVGLGLAQISYKSCHQKMLVNQLISSFSFRPFIRSNASATTSHMMVMSEPGLACS